MLTSTQVQQLLSLLQLHQNDAQADTASNSSITVGMVFSASIDHFNIETTSYILDSGATSYITNCFSLLSDHRPLQNFHVFLPNHTRVQVHAIGTICLSNALIICNVLYIPSFV